MPSAYACNRMACAKDLFVLGSTVYSLSVFPGAVHENAGLHALFDVQICSHISKCLLVVGAKSAHVPCSVFAEWQHGGQALVLKGLADNGCVGSIAALYNTLGQHCVMAATKGCNSLKLILVYI